MMKRPLKPLSLRRRFERLSPKKRLGAVILLASGMMIMVFGFLAFTVDVGYISLTKAQLESANDAGARAAVLDLKDGLGTGATMTAAEAQYAASTAAVYVVGKNRAGDQSSIYVDPGRDLRFGQAIYDPNTGSWQKIWARLPQPWSN